MESIWSISCELPKYEKLQSDIETEVAIIGGGLAGVLTAYKLKSNGTNAVILEADRLCSGQTKNTTAKITSQHGHIYEKLINDFGKEKAKQYALANNRAIDEYQKIIEKNSIDCNFERLPAYLYSTSEIEPLKNELKAAESLGLPAGFVEKTELPFYVKGAVRFDMQAQFNPLKFVKSITENLKIYENTRVKNVEKNTIITDNYAVKAKHIVFACHYPFINAPGYYFLRMHQERSYALALENAPHLNGMYYSLDNNGYSLRNYENLLIFGGEGHRTGENSQGGRYDKLRKAAAEYFSDSREVAYWSAQDCVTLDTVPYIGQFSNSTPNWYVATGFKKWGMTTSMVAANIITDMICNRENRDAEVFSPERFTVSSVPELLKDTGQAVKGLARENLTVARAKLDELPIGHGGVVETNGKKVGVYKDSDGKIFLVDTRCTHLGCQLEWNPDEKSWDCPCHGSRFFYDGSIINNPAIKDIDNERLF